MVKFSWYQKYHKPILREKNQLRAIKARIYVPKMTQVMTLSLNLANFFDVILQLLFLMKQRKRTTKPKFQYKKLTT